MIKCILKLQLTKLKNFKPSKVYHLKLKQLKKFDEIFKHQLTYL